MGERNDERGQNGADRRDAGADRGHAAGQGDRPRRHGGGQPPLRGGGSPAVPHGVALARHPGAVRKAQQRVQAVPAPGPFGGLRARFRHPVRGVRPRARVRRRYGRPGAPEGGGLKRGASSQGIGRSRGGLTTRAVAVVDALGYPVRFTVLPGQAHDPRGCRISPAASRSGPPSATGRPAPTGCWRIWSGAEAVIPSKRNRTARRGRDRDVSGRRRPVESFFAGTGEFRAIATRHHRTDGSFAAGIHPVAGVVAAR